MTRVRALLALALLLLWAPDLGTQQQPLRVHFIDVGQGDAVLIQSPTGQNVLYDGGGDPIQVRDYLTSLGITEVGLVIASHNHADHIGGLAEVLRTFRPPFYMDNGLPATTQTYAGVLEAVAEVGSQLVEPVLRRIELGDASLVVVPPPGIPAWDQNDNSIGVVVEYGSFRLSLMGDAEPREWAWWLTNHRALFAPVLVHKSSHHGSSNGDTSAGLALLAPRAVAIGVGEGNTYGHPTAEALRLYGEKRATVYRTDRNGTIIVEAQSSGLYSVRLARGEGAPKGGSQTQATQVAVRVPWTAQSGLSGTAEASAAITPAAAAPCTSVGIATNLRATASGSTVTFSWTAASGSPTDYLLGIGTSIGASNVSTTTVTGTTFTWNSVPSGTYYARLWARNSCGTGSPSNEATVTVGGGGGGSAPPSSWSGPLPSPTLVNRRPTCSASLFPSEASCANNIVGVPSAVCGNGRYSCSARASGTCSGNDGVHCWKCPGPLC